MWTTRTLLRLLLPQAALSAGRRGRAGDTRHPLLLCDNESCVYDSYQPVEFGHMT